MVKVKKTRLSIASVKLIKAVSLLKEDGFWGSAEGLSKIFKGMSDSETNQFAQAPYYGYWPSFSKKKLKGRLTQLVRHGYLSNVWVKEEQDYFLTLTPLGEEAILEFTLPKKSLPAKKEFHTIRPLK
jgi:hypothetical protein